MGINKVEAFIYIGEQLTKACEKASKLDATINKNGKTLKLSSKQNFLDFLNQIGRIGFSYTQGTKYMAVYRQRAIFSTLTKNDISNHNLSDLNNASTLAGAIKKNGYETFAEWEAEKLNSELPSGQDAPKKETRKGKKITIGEKVLGVTFLPSDFNESTEMAMVALMNKLIETYGYDKFSASTKASVRRKVSEEMVQSVEV